MGTHEQKKRQLMRLAWVGAVLLPIAAVAVMAVWLGQISHAAQNGPADLAALEGFQRGFTAVASAMRPSVVFIEVERKVDLSSNPSGSDNAPDLREFFGPDSPFSAPSPQRPQQTPRIPVGQGSGFVIDPAGFIVTNNHVVENAARVTVRLEDGESYPAQVTGTDPLTDLAVIKIEPRRKLKPAVLGDAKKAEVGAWAIAVGFPFGGNRSGGSFDAPLHYEAAINVGVVSALNRQITSEAQGYPFRDLIQTDAQINPGNSGGPLVNIRAEVIGINQAIYTSGLSGGNIGVGFAIPINARTKAIIETLKGGEKVVRGRLGLSVAPVTNTMKRVYGTEAGVFVEEVEKDSPAARAGFRPEDIILEYQGQKIAAQDEFVNLVQSTKPGTTVTVRVLRDGKEVDVKPTVEAMAAAPAQKRTAAVEPQKLGISVEAAPEDVLSRANLSGGVRVRAVDPVSDAARAGLQAGDIIITVNRADITDVASYQRAVSTLKRGDPTIIRIWRGGHQQTLEIESISE